MSFPSYLEHAESGVDWLGKVPSHWCVKRLRHITELNPSKGLIRKKDPEMETTFLPMEAVGEDGSLDLSETRRLGEVVDGYTYLQENDVAYAKITPCFENGKAALLRDLKNGVGFGTTELTVLRPYVEHATPEYLHRVVTSEPFQSLGEASMYGAGGQKRVPDAFARNFAIAWPPVSEQTQIARFLDHETARIDALIAEQERLIELLGEKRQAVISHAVTKGLDPDAPMTDSGVEWFGEVPAHWKVGTLRRVITSVSNGTTATQGDEGYETVCVSRIETISAGEINYRKVGFVEMQSGLSRFLLNPGDILLSHINSLPMVGNVALYKGERPLLHGMNLLRIEGLKPTSSEWLFYWLKSNNVRQELESRAKPAINQASISTDSIRSIPVYIPPSLEQTQIARFLHHETACIDALIAEQERLIELLGERRRAVISAAVTGKIDVRDWQPPASEAQPPSAQSGQIPA